MRDAAFDQQRMSTDTLLLVGRRATRAVATLLDHCALRMWSGARLRMWITTELLGGLLGPTQHKGGATALRASLAARLSRVCDLLLSVSLGLVTETEEEI